MNDVSNDLEKLKTTKSEFEKEEASIKEKLSRNYGPHDVFTKMDGECFEYKVDQYIYKVKTSK